MIDTYLTDTVDIISIASDEWGVSTESVQADVAARIEDVNKLILDQNGKEVVGNMLVMLNASVVIRNTDLIRIKKKCGETLEFAAKKFPVKMLGKEHGFTSSHWEVYI